MVKKNSKIILICLGLYSCLVLLACQTSSEDSPNAISKADSSVQKKDIVQGYLEKLNQGPIADDEINAYFLIGQQLLFEKNFGAAERIFAALFEAKPSIDIGLKLFEIRVISAKLEAAEDLIKKLGVIFPQHAEPYVALATVYMARGNFEEAEQLVKEGLANIKDSENLAMTYIELLLKQNKDIEAKKNIEIFVNKYPESSYFLKKLIEIELRKKQMKKVKVLLDKLLHIAPESVDTWSLAGYVAMQEEDYKASEAYFREAYIKQPENNEVVRLYCMQLLKQKKYQEAKRLLLKLEKSTDVGKSFDSELARELAYIYFELGEYKEAKERFLNVASELEDVGVGYFYAGHCAELEKNYVEAKELYGRVPNQSSLFRQAFKRTVYLDMNVGDFEGVRKKIGTYELEAGSDESDFIFKATALSFLKDYAGASKIVKQGLNKFPKAADLDFLQASWKEFQVSKQAAVVAMELHLIKFPKNAQALNYLAYTLSEIGVRLEYAKVLVKRALALEPKNGAFLDTQGWVLVKLGLYSQAELSLVRALAETPDEPILYEHLAEVFYLKKNYSKALQMYETADGLFLTLPKWKRENDKELKESFSKVQLRIKEIRNKALSDD